MIGDVQGMDVDAAAQARQLAGAGGIAAGGDHPPAVGGVLAREL